MPDTPSVESFRSTRLPPEGHVIEGGWQAADSFPAAGLEGECE